MRKRKLTTIAPIAFLLFMGAGCLDSDVSLVLGFVSSWLQQRGVIDAKGNPTAGTVKYVGSGGWISSGDKDNDALIDGGLVVKGLKDADNAVDAAHDSANLGNYADAHATLDMTLRGRPDDHHVRNAKGTIYVKQGRGTDANKYLASRSTCDTTAGAVGPADYARCSTMLRDERDQLYHAQPITSIKAPEPDSETCRVLRQRLVTISRLEDIARLQSKFDEADRHKMEYQNLENGSPTCRK